MKRGISLAVILVTALMTGLLPVIAQDAVYAESGIADSLRKNANAVIRTYKLEYTYLSPTANRLSCQKAITVLNKNGDKEAVFSQYYDKFRKFTSLVIILYDASGNLIRKVKGSEISDISGSGDYDLYSDIRYKYYEPLQSEYPYTVEVMYEMELSGSYNFPEWMGFYDFNVSIEKTTFRVNVPESYVLHYHLLEGTPEPEITSADRKKSYHWTITGVKALDSEPYRDELFRYVQGVLTAPSDFEQGGYPGKLNTWDDLATWINSLCTGRDVLPAERVMAMQELTSKSANVREKIKILYHYLQKNTRYFNIKLGLGGLQPMEASRVDAVGYGDCKGLSIYMKSMLKAIGIPSHLVLVESGRDFPQVIPDFPSHQFNHMILCVPVERDTIWLECTSQQIPFGFLGDFTSNREALLIGENGGKLVRTPVYPGEQNYQITTSHVKLSVDGHATASISRRFGWLQFDDYQEELYMGPKDMKEWLYGYFRVPNPRIDQFSFKAGEEDTPESVLQVLLHSDNYSTPSGKRLFLPVNLVNQSTYVPSKISKRWGRIRRLVPYTDVDSASFALQEGLDIEFIPESKKITSRFGTYSFEVQRIPGGILSVRRVQMVNGLFPADTYEELIKFYKDISTADRAQAILVKKDP